MQQLTKEQAAIIGLFTGISCGPFSDIHELAEKLYGKPIFTHQFADHAFVDELKNLVGPMFFEICNKG